MTDHQPSAHLPDLAALSAYFDKELDAAEHRRLAAHLDGCAQCRGHLAELQAFAAELRALPMESLGFDLAGVIAGRLDAAPRPPAAERGHNNTWLGWPLLVGAAASLAIGVSMGSLLLAGGAATAPRSAALAVFDALPPGSLCIGLDACYAKGSLK